MSFKVYPSDAKTPELGYCNKGMRILAKRKGLNWNDVVQNGVDSSFLESFNEPMINELVEAARKRVNNE